MRSQTLNLTLRSNGEQTTLSYRPAREECPAAVVALGEAEFTLELADDPVRAADWVARCFFVAACAQRVPGISGLNSWNRSDEPKRIESNGAMLFSRCPVKPYCSISAAAPRCSCWKRRPRHRCGPSTKVLASANSLGPTRLPGNDLALTPHLQGTIAITILRAS